MSDLAAGVRRVAAESGFSGVVRADRPGEPSYAEAFGLAHRGLQVPNTVATRFALASGGKTFTALAVMSLVTEGVLALDTPAREHLGADLPLVGDDVTIEHLLSHTSGIGDYIDEDDDDYEDDDYVLDVPVHRLDRTEAFLPDLEGHPAKFGAGERFAYCNGGYMVLALVAERASGTPYHDLVRDRVIEPAGLTDTGFWRSDEPDGRTALGYLHPDGLRTNLLHLPVRGNGDGGLISTVDDIHAFWAALMDGRILPLDVVARMTSGDTDAPEEGARYGLGFWHHRTEPIIQLLGGDAGATFWSSHAPAAGTTWTVISNVTDGMWPVSKHVRAAFGEPPPAPTFQ